MSVTSVDKDLDNLTITLVAEFDAPADQVWDLWADPRKLERWWGPPGYPATFERHDLNPGGEAVYYMTSPEGERHYGWWKVEEVDPPRSFQFKDAFADENGKPTDDMGPPGTVRVQLTEEDGRTRMEIRSSNETREQMQAIIDMGGVEGLQQSVGQMDALLGE
jgi:uncharacterized protein YndB with AHSA1/START domain